MTTIYNSTRICLDWRIIKEMEPFGSYGPTKDSPTPRISLEYSYWSNTID